jgi:arylsulfatase A-like enzyme
MNGMTPWLATALILATIGGDRAERGGSNPGQSQLATQPPNFVIILTDDLGYGDLGVQGHPTIRTPRLDRMAAEGQRWTSFYAAPVCTPSRAQLLTGRLAIRSGLASGVLFPDSFGGLQPTEVTVAEVLKQKGYATAAIGKWHLGHLPEFLPTNQGFDSYFGIPYSNDMDRQERAPRDTASPRFLDPKPADFNVPIMRGDKIIERPADQTTVTRRYTDEAIAFMRKNQNQPFFLYLAHNLPHVPLFRSKEFDGRSARGLYGDVVEEIDHNVGRVLDALRELKLDRRTLVLFLSDNGPWLPYLDQGGSAGLLRNGKATTWEGGVRVPAIFFWPGTIPPGTVVDGIGSELDVLQTFAALAGVPAPRDRILDGHDLSPTLHGKANSPRQTLFYYQAAILNGVRRGSFKIHSEVSAGRTDKWELFNLDHDPSEKIDLARARPEVVADLLKLAQEHQTTIVPVEDQIPKRLRVGAPK